MERENWEVKSEKKAQQTKKVLFTPIWGWNNNAAVLTPRVELPVKKGQCNPFVIGKLDPNFRVTFTETRDSTLQSV